MGIHSHKLNDNPDEQWHDAQHDEKAWWGNCVNTIWEETKQIQYAALMGIEFESNENGPYNIPLNKKRVLDIGGGPVSLLLKSERGSNRTVVDPCEYPDWVAKRYVAAGIEYLRLKGEQIGVLISSGQPKYDEVWIYNVLQHTDDPALIMKLAKDILVPGGTLRIFEWIDTDQNVAHPHILSEATLNEWIGQNGKTTEMNAHGCYGPAYYGIFTIGVPQ